MHNVEDVISDSEDEFTIFLKPIKQNRFSEDSRHITEDRSHVIDPTLAAQDDNEEASDSEEVYFNMTQMQSIHESVTALEKETEIQKRSIMSLRSLRCDSFEPTEEYKVLEPVKKRGKKRQTTGTKSRKKNQSMSDLVREVFESDKSKYFIAKQSRIDEYCARSKNNSMSRTLQNRRSEYFGEKQLLTPTDWLEILQSLKICFPRTQCCPEIQAQESTEYRTIWDEASSNVILNKEEMNILYNK